MKALFRKRRQEFQHKHTKYLPYVFNDHFVLVLLFLLGFILFQYSQLLKHFPANPLPIQLGLLIAVLFLLNLGSVATYLEKADQHFLLTKEAEVIAHIRSVERLSFILWSSLQTVLLLPLFPLFQRLGVSLLAFVLLLVVLVLAKRLLLKRKVASFLSSKGLDWEKAIAFEADRQQAILKFYALFTNVKGISTKVKERPYLNPILKLIKADSKKVWTNLYLRAFLRSSDYLGLFLRLLLLSCLSLAFISNSYLAVGLALVFHYLSLFQLLSLYHHYDYHYMSGLYPTKPQHKQRNLLSLLRQLSGLMLIVNLVLCRSWQNALVLIVAMGLLNLLYLPYKLKKMID